MHKTDSDHNNWFKEQVKEGIQQANNPDTVWMSSEEVAAISIQRRIKWEKQYCINPAG